MKVPKKTSQKYGKDKSKSGEFKDLRKSALFHISESEIPTKTQLDGLRETVFMDRYSLKDSDGASLEKYPEQMWLRVAKGIAQFEEESKRKEWEQKFYGIMSDFKFVPGGRILSGAGTGYEVTFFNCYVIPSPSDSRGGIMENITQTVEIQSRAGGVGVNLSSLRPRGARVRKVNGTSSGPVNWASLYSTANHDVIQQGGSRRGALMLMLNDWHPDVKEFIKVKEDLTKIPGANLSVCVSDEFMDAVKNDSDWDLVFPDFANDDRYDELWNGDIDKWKENGGKVVVYETVKARKLWDMIAEAAWKSAEPGLHFIGRSNKRSNTWYFEKLIATNPCGEQPLGAWAVCNLGAMNLVAYVDGNGEFNFDQLASDVQIAMRFMDNVCDANFYFYPETYEMQMDIRRTGLGTMGLGDALIKMKIAYGSDKSVEVIEKIYKTIRDNAYLASSEIAGEKGSFRKFESDKYLNGYFIKKLPKYIRENIAKKGIRNAVLLTQAPTGTTSLLSGVSSGIEPVYNFEFKRKDRTGEHMVYHPLFEEWKKAHPDSEKPDYFVCAMDLSPEEHLKVQAKIQEYTDSSISKTVNAPNEYTVEDVKRLYTKAYEMGCKGITFFRDGSRAGVLENVKEEKKEEKAKEEKAAVAQGDYLIERPFMVKGATYKMQTPSGKAFITINEDGEGEPLEVFINVGNAGSDIAAFAEALGRMISATLRMRGSISAKKRALEISEQLSGIGGRRSVGFGANRIMSLPDAIGIALATHYGFRQNLNLPTSNGVHMTNGNGHSNGLTNGHTTNDEVKQTLFAAGTAESTSVTSSGMMLQVQAELPLTGKQKTDLCPECGSHSLVMEEGCAKCYTCGHSEC